MSTTTVVTYYIVNEMNIFIGSVTSTEIDVWISVMNKNIPKSEGSSYTIDDYKGIHKISELALDAPPSLSNIARKNGTWVDNTPPSIVIPPDIESLRKAAFVAEADSLKMKADELAAINNTNPDYTAWLQSKAAIRARYPKPVASTSTTTTSSS